jgi:hypothetical protein
MGKIIKLALGLLVIVACFQAGRALVNNYNFEDAVSQMLVLASARRASDAEIVRQVISIAVEYDVPLEASNVTIRHERLELAVDMEYDEDVALIPAVYTKTWTFRPTATARLLNPQ